MNENYYETEFFKFLLALETLSFSVSGVDHLLPSNTI